MFVGVVSAVFSVLETTYPDTPVVDETIPLETPEDIVARQAAEEEAELSPEETEYYQRIQNEFLKQQRQQEAIRVDIAFKEWEPSSMLK